MNLNAAGTMLPVSTGEQTPFEPEATAARPQSGAWASEVDPNNLVFEENSTPDRPQLQLGNLMNPAKLPETIEFDGLSYAFEKSLKDDFFSQNYLYQEPGGKRCVLKVSDFRFIGGFLLKPIAGFMSRHEHHMYDVLDDLPGVPKAGPRCGRRAFVHEYVEGISLFDAESSQMKDEFFPALLNLTKAIHARGIIYLDGNKKGNIIVGPDGMPSLIDYQISINFGKLHGLGAWKLPLFRWLVQEDIYHVYKHKLRYHPHLVPPEDYPLCTRSKKSKALATLIGNPYRFFKRLIYPKGSNETIWYKWKRAPRRSETD